MSEQSGSGTPGFSLDAAHARDREKELVYPPRPPAEAPDFAALRQRVLEASKDARGHLGDDET